MKKQPASVIKIKNYLIGCLLLMPALSFAQNNIGIGTQTPHSSALLDVSSTTRGLLAPRMTTTQRIAIASPAKGLLVYDIEVNSLFHFNGTDWVNLSAGGGGGTGWSLTGNAGTMRRVIFWVLRMLSPWPSGSTTSGMDFSIRSATCLWAGWPVIIFLHRPRHLIGV